MRFRTVGIAVISLFITLLVPSALQALIFLPNAHLTIVKTTDGEDGLFHFDLKQASGIVFVDYNQFDLQTQGAFVSTGTSISFPDTTKYLLTEDVPQDWTLASVECTSDLPGATFVQQSNGVIISAIQNSNITCTFHNTKSTTPPACTENCNSNVLFLPGMEASRLYRPARPDEGGIEKQLWEPRGDQNAQDLSLDANGKEGNLFSPQSQIYTRDPIDEAYALDLGPNIYKSFIGKMDSLKSGNLIADWASVPYDWRLSLDDIISGGTKTGDNISYIAPSSDPYVASELMRLATSSRTHKVTVVAHSNGGLVIKALLLKRPDLTQYIDRIIFVDVPQVGTPQAIAALLHGENQGLPTDAFPLLLSTRAARSFAQNAPVAYNLLPSFNYFSSVSDPVVTLDPVSLPDWVSRYGSAIELEGQLRNYLTDSYKRVDSQSSDIIDPTQLNSTLLTQAETAHASLDAWTPPAGVQLIQIAGWGIPTTMKGIEYASTTKSVFCANFCEQGLTMTASTTLDGDGTVVVPSALWTSATLPNVRDYWVDLNTYNKSHLNRKHADILEVDGLYNFIADTISSSTKPLPSYTYLTTQSPPSSGVRLRYELHSPLSLDLYDDQGYHTGVSTTTGRIEAQIPGTYYFEFGSMKYLFTNASSVSRIVMSSYATSTFTFGVDELQGDVLIATSTFKDIPTTPQTRVTLDTTSDISTLSPMHIDLNGDGTTDYNLSPKLNDTVTLDTVPPEIQIKFSTSTNALAYTATDDSGNAALNAITSHPTLKKNQTGLATTTLTARDGMGNTTVLTFTQKYPPKDRRININALSVSYNGVVMSLATTTLKYKWNQNSGSAYKMLASFIQIGATSTESHWRPKKNLTIIMTKPTSLDDSDTDDDADARPTMQKLPGLVIPYLVTQKGKINVSY